MTDKKLLEAAAQELLGYMYIARKPCGKVVAVVWDDPHYAKETAKSVASWIARGDTIERIPRYKDDPQPDWVCSSKQDCKCMDEGLRK